MPQKLVVTPPSQKILKPVKKQVKEIEKVVAASSEKKKPVAKVAPRQEIIVNNLKQKLPPNTGGSSDPQILHIHVDSTGVAKKPRKVRVLTDEQKQACRDRLEKARAVRDANKIRTA